MRSSCVTSCAHYEVFSLPQGLDRGFPTDDEQGKMPWEQMEERATQREMKRQSRHSPSSGKVWTHQTGWTDPAQGAQTHEFLKRKRGHQAWEACPGPAHPELEEEEEEEEKLFPASVISPVNTDYVEGTRLWKDIVHKEIRQVQPRAPVGIAGKPKQIYSAPGVNLVYGSRVDRYGLSPRR